MASQNEAPYVPQDPKVVGALIQALERSQKKNQPGSGKKAASCKKATFPVEGTDGLTVDSWRYQDWDYKRDDLPTYARGLFTCHRRDGTPEIVIRGYDKFFNQEEVNETKWRNVEIKTQGPYELSVKENGCIIFISGLEDGTLLVCSKHSTGPRDDADLSHAVAGEKWVDKHLAAIGRTRRDLAMELRKRNATAVAELCDDSFEEHVLAYDEKTAGLYIHGINLNLPDFATYPGHMVHKFADEWGFKKAEFLVKDDTHEVKTFLDACSETGSWSGRDTEGFVIRCQQHDRAGGPLHNWFFKYKFEEPYLMYRQWREVTKAVIAGKPPRYKKHKKITEEYLAYAKRQLAKTPGLGKAFNANHGIIAMRDGFLQQQGLKGSDIIRQEEENDEHNPVTRNVILLPIASIGCGKTTLAIALVKLFGWGQVQNDNITGKSNRPKQFATQVCKALESAPVMIADRNNHQRRERKQIIDDVSVIIPDARFVALHYVHDPKPQKLPEIRRVTQERVLARGDNHQTIQAGSKSQKEIIGIMEGFLSRFEPLDPDSPPDSYFDEVIHLDVAASSRQNLETVVNSMHSMYPKLIPEVPSPGALDEAIEAALHDYQPTIKHDLSFKSNSNKAPDPSPSQFNQGQNGGPTPKAPKVEYFNIQLPTKEILSVLEKTFSSTLPPEITRFYHQLQISRRIQPSFHVTLIHRASIESHPDLWSRLNTLHQTAVSNPSAQPQNIRDAQSPPLGTCRVQLERVVWDSRVMCIVARLLDEGWESANAVAHVTVGTAGREIKPKESNELLARWLQGGSGGETGIEEVRIEIEGEGLVGGTVRAVMQTGGR
ncbi:MAG: tRNA ligase [Lasallia pustulata]|uniref:tRNA ligase n=1 Tax=Lasallia pustulata TaxID=136370 RepID=A0A5M8PD08_9LECA|nr:MAG: tRNA ligase [Lasallia pustulata]